MTATTRAVELVEIAAAAAADKLASDIIAYDVSEQLVITDAFLLCSASNDRQVRAIVDEIEERLRKAGARPGSRRERHRWRDRSSEPFWSVAARFPSDSSALVPMHSPIWTTRI